MIAEPAFRPVPTLLGAPASALSDVLPGDVCLAGLFMDHGAIRFGARFAARQLRYASAGRTPPERCRDLGDLNVFPLEPARHDQALRRQLAAVRAEGGRLVIVGGAADLGPVFAAVLGAAAEWTLPASPPHVPPGAGLTIDVAPLVGGVPRWLRPLRDVDAGLVALDAAAIGAVHLRGLAPAFDAAGRWEASIGLHVLSRLVARLAAP